MSISLEHWCGPFSRLLLLLLVLTSIASCSKSPLSLLAGGGTAVAANTQVGKTNTQTLGKTSNTEQSVKVGNTEKVTQSADSNSVRADKVETVVINEVPAWVIFLLLLGWLLPSPNEIGRWIRGLFVKTK